VEEGKIIHKGIQGASSSNVHTLTAYCPIAYTEAINNMESNQIEIIWTRELIFWRKSLTREHLQRIRTALLSSHICCTC